MKDETEALIMRMYETVQEFNERLGRSPISEELSVMFNIDRQKTYMLLRKMETRGMIDINRKKRPSIITIAKKKPKKPIIEPTVVLKGKQQLIQKVKVGDRITMRRPALDKDFEDKERERVFTVIGIYPNHVLGVDVKTGSKRCISYGDLIKKGLEHQADKLEALRK
jgi:hypothetical protein